MLTELVSIQEINLIIVIAFFVALSFCLNCILGLSCQFYEIRKQVDLYCLLFPFDFTAI